jgi:hypothetical protein
MPQLAGITVVPGILAVFVGPAIAGFPYITGVSAVAGILAFASNPVVVGIPAIASVCTIAGEDSSCCWHPYYCVSPCYCWRPYCYINNVAGSSSFVAFLCC